MEITQVTGNKKEYLELLLLADEAEDMIDKYLGRGDMYRLTDGGIVQAVFVVTDEGNGVYELKNISVAPEAQRRGYGRACVAFVCRQYGPKGNTLIVGTGDSPLTMPFYEGCGFREFRRVKNFFIDNYDHPMYECGRQLIDMVYLKRPLP